MKGERGEGREYRVKSNSIHFVKTQIKKSLFSYLGEDVKTHT